MTSNQRIGTTADRDYVVVRLELRDREGAFTTVDHEQITSYVEVSLMGEEVAYRCRNPHSVGQIVDSLDRITVPAAGWTLDEVREVRTLWDRWHLNGMRAACSHMDPATLVREETTYGPRISTTDPANTCPVSGYRYGHAWLVEVLPDEVRDRLVHLFRDRSADLYRERGYDAFGKAVPSE